jgi:hypothetical protein
MGGVLLRRPSHSRRPQLRTVRSHFEGPGRPHAGHRSLFLSAGTSPAPRMDETSMIDSCTREHVTSTDVHTPKSAMGFWVRPA